LAKGISQKKGSRVRAKPESVHDATEAPCFLEWSGLPVYHQDGPSAILSFLFLSLAPPMPLSEDGRDSALKQDAHVMEIVHNYWFWMLVALGWLFSSAVDTMPE